MLANQKNVPSSAVLNQPLTPFSQQRPTTGFWRDGYCRTGPADFGNHAVAGIMSRAFLDFMASRGNDLSPAGVTPGCRWCLCASRWKEALEAYTSGRVRDADVVPKVVLEATNATALRTVDVEELRRFAVDDGEKKE
jgi:uncharacterized protein (DUF2237 family)